MPGFSRQERLGINLAQNATIPTLTTPPSSHEGKDGDKRIVASGFGKGPRMYIKSEGMWWYTEFLPTSSHPVESEKQFNTLHVRDRLAMDTGSFAMAGTYHRFVADVPIRAASQTDNSVVIQIPGLKFPAYTCIVFAAVMVKQLSNANTQLTNLQISETAGTAVGSSISSGTELIGAGGTTKADSGGSDIVSRPQNTSANALSSSGTDINFGENVVHAKDVFFTQVPYFHDSANDFYAYLCNAGTSGGALDAITSGVNATDDPVSLPVTYLQRFRVGEIVKMSSEHLLVTALSATTGIGNVTATRAQNGTSAAVHSTAVGIYTLTPTEGVLTVIFDYIGSF